jgi:hypothetical protein
MERTYAAVMAAKAAAKAPQKLQLRIVASNPLGVFNAGEALIVLCEVYHNDSLLCRFDRLSSEWYATARCLHELPKSSRLRLSFLRPANTSSIATFEAFEECGIVEVPLRSGSRWVDGFHTVALTKDYEDVTASGWVDVCGPATRHRWVRAYIVMRGTVLKWQATEAGGDGDALPGVQQWQFVYLDQNLFFDFPSQRPDARAYLSAGFGAVDIFQASAGGGSSSSTSSGGGTHGPVLSVAPVLDSSPEAEQLTMDSLTIVQSILENAHVYPSGMLQKNFPAVFARSPAAGSDGDAGDSGAAACNIDYGKALDGVTRSIVIQLQAVPAAEVRELTSSVRGVAPPLLEGSVNVLQVVQKHRKQLAQWPSADSSRLVQALLVL